MVNDALFLLSISFFLCFDGLFLTDKLTENSRYAMQEMNVVQWFRCDYQYSWTKKQNYNYNNYLSPLSWNSIPANMFSIV